MKINPAAAYMCLTNAQMHLKDQLAGTLFLLADEIVLEDLKTQLKTVNSGVYRERDLRTWLAATITNEKIVGEFRLNSIPMGDTFTNTSVSRIYDLVSDAALFTFANEGTVRSFIFMVKEEATNTYNSVSGCMEVLYGTVGKIGDVEQKDLMMKDNAVTANSEVVINDISVNIQC
tara:strand:+ start:518 stop:1042 length:525 start_codon:yes stop_codon:yes gene_type:complete